jgi:hypothetical protein
VAGISTANFVSREARSSTAPSESRPASIRGCHRQLVSQQSSLVLQWMVMKDSFWALPPCTIGHKTNPRIVVLTWLTLTSGPNIRCTSLVTCSVTCATSPWLLTKLFCPLATILRPAWDAAVGGVQKPLYSENTCKNICTECKVILLRVTGQNHPLRLILPAASSACIIVLEACKKLTGKM